VRAAFSADSHLSAPANSAVPSPVDLAVAQVGLFSGTNCAQSHISSIRRGLRRRLLSPTMRPAVVILIRRASEDPRASPSLARRINRFHCTGCWNDTPPLPFQAVAWGE